MNILHFGRRRHCFQQSTSRTLVNADYLYQSYKTFRRGVGTSTVLVDNHLSYRHGSWVTYWQPPRPQIFFTLEPNIHVPGPAAKIVWRSTVTLLDPHSVWEKILAEESLRLSTKYFNRSNAIPFHSKHGSQNVYQESHTV